MPTSIPKSVARRSMLAVAALAFMTTAGATPSAAASAYLEHALGLMERHSIRRTEVDWPALRERTLDAAHGARTAPDTHDALRSALEALGDNHSALIPPGRTLQPPQAHDAVSPVADAAPDGQVLDARIAYLRVPGHPGGDDEADRAFAEALQLLIHGLDAERPCAWIVDLRDNPGGNMWPMLAGLQPLLGDGVVGSFRYPSGAEMPWWVMPGASGAGDAVHSTSRLAYALHDGAAPVAVLTGPATASSGEAVAVAFRGRAATRSFGSATFGVSTGNRGFLLDDGTILFITASRFADRDGNVYGDALEPDVAVPPADALASAVDWLESGNACLAVTDEA